MQSKPGAMLAANYAVPTADVVASLNRHLSGNAPNVTVNLVAPGTMYGNRLNQLDVRVGKIFGFARSQALVALDIYNALNSSAVLTYNNTYVPGGPWLQPLVDPDAACLQDHRRAEILSGEGHVPPRHLLFLESVLGSGELLRSRRSDRHQPGRVGLARPAACQVLVLFSTRRDAPLSVAADRELPRLLDQGLPGGVDYFSEYIDRREDSRLRAMRRRSVSSSARSTRDTASTWSSPSRMRPSRSSADIVSELFPDTPIVFLAMSPPAHDLSNSTGIIVDADLSGTLALALELQPDIRHVFVVSGAGVPDKGYDARARGQLRRFESRVSINYLSGLPTKDLEARLASLPRQSIVYYLVVYQDGDGTLFSPLKYLDRVVAVANAPTYSWSESTMDHGIVGRPVARAAGDGRGGGRAQPSRLHGERAGTIPTSSPDLTESQVDWRQLRRWGISEARVPEGTRSCSGSPGCGSDTRSTFSARWRCCWRRRPSSPACSCSGRGAGRPRKRSGAARRSSGRATGGSVTSEGACSARRKPSARALPASCTTTSASNWRCSKSISSS